MTKVFDKLFSRRSDGKVQVWWGELDGDSYRFHSGILDGLIVTSEFTTAKPKNVGKKNERSAEEQAEAELLSHYKKKQDKDYRKKIDEVDDVEFTPMLAKDYNDYETKFPIHCQPKLDGCRCVTKGASNIEHNVSLVYRSGKPVMTIPHIAKALTPIFSKNPNLILDGEIYAHKFADNFNEIISLARKTKPTKKDLEESEKHLEYHIYDCYLGGQEKFSERYEFLKSLSFSGPLKLVETELVTTQDDLDEKYAKYMTEGYEGQMVRLDKPYEQKRSKFLLKRKVFQDEEFIIEDITEGDGNRSGVAGRCHFLTKEGKPFTANIKGDYAFYKRLLDNKSSYIGTEATVKFFNWTPEKIPRFPVVIKFEKE
jgi:DNA ligase-1